MYFLMLTASKPKRDLADYVLSHEILLRRSCHSNDTKLKVVLLRKMFPAEFHSLRGEPGAWLILSLIRSLITP